MHTLGERSLRRAGRPLRAQLRRDRVWRAVPEWGGGRGRGPELRGRDKATAVGEPSPQVDAERLALLQDAGALLVAHRTPEGPGLLADHGPRRRLAALRHVAVDGPVHRAAGFLAGADARLCVRGEVAEFGHIPLIALLCAGGVDGGRGRGESPGHPGRLRQDLTFRLPVLRGAVGSSTRQGSPGASRTKATTRSAPERSLPATKVRSGPPTLPRTAPGRASRCPATSAHAIRATRAASRAAAGASGSMGARDAHGAPTQSGTDGQDGWTGRTDRTDGQDRHGDASTLTWEHQLMKQHLSPHASTSPFVPTTLQEPDTSHGEGPMTRRVGWKWGWGPQSLIPLVPDPARRGTAKHVQLSTVKGSRSRPRADNDDIGTRTARMPKNGNAACLRAAAIEAATPTP